MISSAAEYLQTAAALVGGQRNETHGDKEECFGRMASMLDAYIAIRRFPGSPIEAWETAIIMQLWKIARMHSGAYNPDDFIDNCGYAGCAAELSELAEIRRDKVDLGGQAII